MKTPRRVQTVMALALVGVGLTPAGAQSQPAATAPLPASAVMARGAGDSWQSRGGVVGPWWSGSGNVVGPPAADGGFWFGLPGLGFGGSQGSSRGTAAFSPGVTALPGATGTMSSSRLIPFVTGVVPVVGSGHSLGPEFPAPTFQWAVPSRTAGSHAAPVPQPHDPSTAGIRPSTAAARHRARGLVASGDLRLRTAAAEEGTQAARAALAAYRSAARFAADEPDIVIRQAILHDALGQGRDADRAIARATAIDARLAAPHEPFSPAVGGFLAEAPKGLPLLFIRGETILAQIAAADEGSHEQPATVRSILPWLRAAWKQRWMGTIAEPAAAAATDSPARRPLNAP